MAHSWFRRSALAFAAAVTLSSALYMAVPLASAAPGDGSAFGLQVGVTLLGGSPINVGPLAASNTAGPTTAGVASVTVPGVVTTGVITTSATEDTTTGAVTSTATTASVGLPLLAAIGAVSADVTVATCNATSSGETGTTTLTNATLGSLGALAVNPAANTTIQISLPVVGNVATLILNEQIPNADGSLTVNAFHLHLLGSGLVGTIGSGDVIISSATCGPAATPAPAPTSTVSALSASTIPLGQSVTDTATVSTATGNPTGSVSFTLCGPLTSASGCASGPALGSPVSLPPTTTGSAAAMSATATPTQPGIYCIGAFYGGDSTHTASSDTTACFTVTPAPTTTTSLLSASTVALGQSVTDTATVATAVGNPTGSVSFTLCGPLTSASGCASGPALGSPVSLPSTTTGSAPATSAVVTPFQLGIWCIGAFYGGDADHTASSDTTACFNVVPAPTTTTSDLSATTIVLGGSVTNTPTVSTLVGNPTGSVSFTLCGPLTSASGCSSSGAALGSPVSLPSTTTGSAAATSATATPFQVGIWCIGAFYGGDVGHQASSDTTACFNVTLPPLRITTTSLPAGQVGSPYSATVEATGGLPPYTWDITNGALPGGITLNPSSGALTGTPVNSGTFTFTVSATDTEAPVVTKLATFTIDVTGTQSAPTAGAGAGAGPTATPAADPTPTPSPTTVPATLPVTGFNLVMSLVSSAVLTLVGLLALGAARLRRRRSCPVRAE